MYTLVYGSLLTVSSSLYSSALPEEHSGPALPVRSPRPLLHPLHFTRLELHPRPLLVLQIQSPVKPVYGGVDTSLTLSPKS